MTPTRSWTKWCYIALFSALSLGSPQAQGSEKEKQTPTKVAPAKAEKPAFKPLIFPSKDGLSLRVDLYAPHKDPKTPFIVLFHQAGWSRGEYRTIAPRLNRMGFNCMAVDQRSGGTINGVINETAKRAKGSKLPTEFVAAKPDIEAALLYARKQLAKGPLLAWGSSYSAALVLQVTGEHPNIADGVLAFAPGEYIRTRGKDWIAKSAANITVPVFVTSAKDEADNWKGIFEAIGSHRKTSYLPKTQGNHGSRALWRKFKDSPGYWVAVTKFLDKHFPRNRKAAANKKTNEDVPAKRKPASKEKPQVQ
ncbi:MAG: alpha/beta hydrolase [bacterium]|nr:alpha/beta hydrolase [bacterium]